MSIEKPDLILATDAWIDELHKEVTKVVKQALDGRIWDGEIATQKLVGDGLEILGSYNHRELEKEKISDIENDSL